MKLHHLTVQLHFSQTVMSKTKILLLLALSFSSWACNKLYAQDPGTPATELVITPDGPNTSLANQSKEEVFVIAEEMPQFPGGEAALYGFLSSNLRYPAVAHEKGIQGCVVVKFVVQKDGSVGDVSVMRSADPSLDREAMRVVKTLPKFIPGKVDGKAVNVWYTLPINFKLTKPQPPQPE